MVQLKPTTRGIQVFTEDGVFIGTAHAMGKPLTSEAALAQLGWVQEPDGDLRPLSDTEKRAALGLGPSRVDVVTPDNAGITDPPLAESAVPRGRTLAPRAVVKKPATKPVAKKPATKPVAAKKPARKAVAK